MSRREIAIVGVLCTAQFMLATDNTVINVANPAIQKTLGFSAQNLHWTNNAFALTFGGFLLLGGRMADVFGRRRLFIAGLALFTLASVAAALAATPAQLIAARAVQGLGASVVAPTTLSLLTSTGTNPRSRARAYAISAMAGSLGGIVGFLLGGVLVSALGWRWIFVVAVPTGLVAIAGALLWIESGEVTRGRRLDLPGATCVTGGLALLMYGLGRALTSGWTGTGATTAWLAAAFLLGLFVLLEARTEDPLFPYRHLRRHAVIANLTSAIHSTATAGTLFLGAISMQQIYSYSAAEAGAASLPLPISYALAVQLGSRQFRRHGARRPAVIGSLFIAAGLAWMAQMPPGQPFASTFLPALLAIGTGLGFVQIPILTTVNLGAKPEHYGIIAGVFNMSQRMGGAVGLAVLATIASAGSNSRLAQASASGIRSAFLVAAFAVLAGAVLAARGLPRAEDVDDLGDSAPVLLADGALQAASVAGIPNPTRYNEFRA